MAQRQPAYGYCLPFCQNKPLKCVEDRPGAQARSPVIQMTSGDRGTLNAPGQTCAGMREVVRRRAPTTIGDDRFRSVGPYATGRHQRLVTREPFAAPLMKGVFFLNGACGCWEPDLRAGAGG